MLFLLTTAKQSKSRQTAKQPLLWGVAKRATPWARSVMAMAILLSAPLALAPVYAQSAAQEPSAPSTPPYQAPATPPQTSTAPATTGTTATTNAAIPVSLGVYKHNYSHAPRAFPNLINPYKPIHIDQQDLTNSPRIDQLIHDGKLEITLQDAVELALENNLDIVVQRYYPWLADANILKAKAGGFGGGTPGGAFGSSTANIPTPSLDPILGETISYDKRTSPVNNPFLAGTGVTGGNTLSGLVSHTASYNTSFFEGFTSGTTVSAYWDNTRASSGSTFNFFNPYVQSTGSVTIAQQLLNGFGFEVNRRNILIAKNNRKIADLAFAQQAITTVTNTITDYWELVYARENVKVQQQSVGVADKLYNDNKKQLEIGTMAPLDVTRAESELATDRQNLIVAQTKQLQQEQILKNAISKDPLAPSLLNVEIIPTDSPTRPEVIEGASFEEGIKEAFEKRPDLQEEALNLKNSAIDVHATRNALLPVATLSATYAGVGLAGNSAINGPGVPIAGAQIVGANGQPILVNSNGTQVPVFVPATSTPVIGTNQQGFTTAQNQLFHNRFPDYAVGLNVSIPLRNRSAQADSARAILTQRQLESQMQQLKNNALLDVRNTYIALEQDRARVEAAAKARELQQQTFDAEQKKYQLGASTVYLVIQTQRDLVTAQGTELRALADLVEAKANYERALGRTLEVNRVTIADAKSGTVERETLIPGTRNGQVIGTEKLFSDNGKAGE